MLIPLSSKPDSSGWQKSGQHHWHICLDFLPWGTDNFSMSGRKIIICYHPICNNDIFSVLPWRKKRASITFPSLWRWYRKEAIASWSYITPKSIRWVSASLLISGISACGIRETLHCLGWSWNKPDLGYSYALSSWRWRNPKDKSLEKTEQLCSGRTKPREH